jgi:hypothetical protein
MLKPLCLVLFATLAAAQVNVTTQHNDLNRSGANLKETILTTKNVNETEFGLLFKRTVDAQIYAQPLYLSNVAIPNQGTHNGVYVATMNNTVYAYDADTSSLSTPLWTVNLGPGIPMTDFPRVLGVQMQIGILGTPVIDPSIGALYVVSYTVNAGTYTHTLHALSVTTGAERFGGPVVISGSVPGTGEGSTAGTLAFDSEQEWQRPALTLVNGVVYIGFGSHGDQEPYHGWLFGYKALTLEQASIWNSSPNGREGPIWQSGDGIAADASGDLYFITGNGDFSANTGGADYGDSLIKLAPGAMSPVVDYFTPMDQATLDSQDLDFGAGGALLIPNSSYVVAVGKTGQLYLTSQTDLGGYNTTGDQVLQTFNPAAGTNAERFYGGMVWWEGPSGALLYYWSNEDYLKAFRFSDGLFETTPAYESTFTSYDCSARKLCFSMPASSLSANGSEAGTGLYWANMVLSGSMEITTASGVLRAFSAADVATELWSSNMNSTRDALGLVAKWVPPTIANGKVYAATNSNAFNVYGLLN